MGKYADDLLANVKKIVQLGQGRPAHRARDGPGLQGPARRGRLQQDHRRGGRLQPHRSVGLQGQHRRARRPRSPRCVRCSRGRTRPWSSRSTPRPRRSTPISTSTRTPTASWTYYDKLTKPQVKTLSDLVAALSEPISKVAAVVAKSAHSLMDRCSTAEPESGLSRRKLLGAAGLGALAVGAAGAAPATRSATSPSRSCPKSRCRAGRVPRRAPGRHRHARRRTGSTSSRST